MLTLDHLEFAGRREAKLMGKPKAILCDKNTHQLVVQILSSESPRCSTVTTPYHHVAPSERLFLRNLRQVQRARTWRGCFTCFNRLTDRATRNVSRASVAHVSLNTLCTTPRKVLPWRPLTSAPFFLQPQWQRQRSGSRIRVPFKPNKACNNRRVQPTPGQSGYASCFRV